MLRTISSFLEISNDYNNPSLGSETLGTNFYRHGSVTLKQSSIPGTNTFSLNSLFYLRS